MIDIQVQEGPLSGVQSDALIVLAFEGDAPSILDQSAPGWAGELYSAGEFAGKIAESVILHRPAGMQSKRVVLAGAGKRERLDANAMRKSVAAAVRTLKGK